MEETSNLNNSRLSQENKLYLKNKVSNQGKIETITFINILTKIEMKFQTLQGYLFWYSILEIFIFFIAIILFFLLQKI